VERTIPDSVSDNAKAIKQRSTRRCGLEDGWLPCHVATLGMTSHLNRTNVIGLWGLHSERATDLYLFFR
jgi:hypothetical protein